MTAKRLQLALVGASGYGAYHLDCILKSGPEAPYELAALVDVDPSRCPRLAEVKARGVRCHTSMEAMYREQAIDVAVIATPIHLHCAQACLALENGSHVYCEKPAAVTIQDAARMAAVEARADRRLAIGFQWSHTRAIQELKRDIMAGHFGRPRRLKTIVSWPRAASYYARSAWAAAVRTAEGAWVLDSPVMNATSHYLHNALYILGATRETSASPVSVQAELYRANAIRNYDSAALRVQLQDGAEVLFYASHAVPGGFGPLAHYEFEKGSIVFEVGANASITARFSSGEIRAYGNPSAEQGTVLAGVVAGIRAGERPACGIAAATPHVLCVDAAQDSMPAITDFPAAMIRKTGDADAVTYADGLQASLIQCYALGILPSEHGGMAWARAGRVVPLRDYTFFPGGQPRAE